MYVLKTLVFFHIEIKYNLIISHLQTKLNKNEIEDTHTKKNEAKN